MHAITPDRAIEITLDAPTTGLVEPFFAQQRQLFEIRDPILDNVEQLASGVWILKPRGTHLFSLHETTAGQVDAIRLSDYVAPPQIAEIPLQRSLTELTGVSPGAGVSPTGDYFYTKRIPAGTSWSIGLVAPLPMPTLPTVPNYPMDTVLEHQTGLDPADQGYVLRWIHPAHPQEYIDYVLSFQFGGLLTPGGYGLFELVFGGDGRAYLYERIADAWSLVDEWRYAASELVPGAPHTVRIIPHAARWIEIRSNITERSQPGFLFTQNRLTAFAGRSLALDAHVYTIGNRDTIGGPGSGLAYPVTGPGHPRFRVRRDVSLRWQLAHVTYPASGTLTDQPFTVPSVDTSDHVLRLRLFSLLTYNLSTLQPLGAVEAEALHATTGAPLATDTEDWEFGGTTYTLEGFTLPGKPNGVRVHVTLTNHNPGGHVSPWFFGYEAAKVGEFADADTTAVVINGTHYRQSPATRISLTGPDADPSHETASLRIADLVNRIPRLSVRGEGRIRITSTFDPADQSRSTVLFDGYWIKSDSRLRGKAGTSYPSPNWRDYDLICLGRWKGIHQRDFLADEILSFGQDLDLTLPPINGAHPPWKVTDAIRFLLVASGIPEAELDIPDLPIRLWVSTPENFDTIQIQPGENALAFARKLAADYLNRYLIRDENAGPNGMWRLKAVPTGSEAAVWHFVLGGPGPGRLASQLSAYPANTSWIQRDTLTEWTVPPEGNFVRVTGEVNGKVFACTARNPKAYNRPGESTADPDHPDYVDGQFHPIFRRHDPTLLTKEAVMFVTRRVFDLACRAQQYARFQGPLVFIDAAASEPSIYTTHTHRKPMHGDVVTLRGVKYHLENVSAIIRKQHHMWAQYDLRKFNDPLPE